MIGNIYITVPLEDIYNELPASITKYDYSEITSQPGEELQTVAIHPTWDAYGQRNKAEFGSPLTITVGDSQYVLYEISASWLDGEVSALLALGAGLSAPSYTLMTAAEAKAFISANAPTLE